MALLTVRLEDDLHQKVKMATVSSSTTMADIVREALTEYIAKNPGGRKAAKKPAAPKKPMAKKATARKAPAKKAKATKAAPRKAAAKRKR